MNRKRCLTEVYIYTYRHKKAFTRAHKDDQSEKISDEILKSDTSDSNLTQKFKTT